LLDLPEEQAFVGQPYRKLLEFFSLRGEFPDGPNEQFLTERMQMLDQREPFSVERVRPNGVALSVEATPLPSGGYIFSCQDITQQRAAREIQRRNAKATVVAMANFAEHRDTDTGVHVLRVSRLSGQIARKLHARAKSREKFSDLDETFIEHIATASILHDVGKISTPDSILLKPGGLSTEEREIMKKHTIDGAHLLRQAKLTMGHSQYLTLGIDIAQSHHEWYDGRGYPHGLAGDAIPLAGRICAVADVYDALTSRRPYKTPWEADQAAALIQAQRGTQFDPDVVDAFLEVFQEREMVSLVRWSDDFSVGNIHIDEQHAILIDTINQLASAESLKNHHCVQMIIDELSSYAVFHFDYEERLMADAGYPDIETHKIIHQAFVSWVAELRDEYIAHGKRPLGESVLWYLRDWLSHHILGEDQRYRPYIQRMD
jgi:hemerythrin-like metal-binding protein